MTKFVPYQKEFLKFAEEIFDSNVPDFVHTDEKKDMYSFLGNLDKEFAYFILFDGDDGIGMCGYIFDQIKNEAVLCWGLLHRKVHKKGFGKEMLLFRISEIKKISPGAKIICRTSQVTEAFFAHFGFKTVESAENYWGDGLHLRKMELSATNNE